MKIEQVVKYLQNYNGKEINLMEVCGTHTSSIFKNGIRSLISDKIKLISGPGCPVCVTPSSYIDKCIEIAMKENHVLVTFGDMMKVPGSKGSLSLAKGNGANVELMYSPFEVAEKAKANKDKEYVIAAVGFETTVPAYGLLIEQLEKEKINNVRILTALKTVIPALEWICENQKAIDGFICPGHVSVIIGSNAYRQLVNEYKKPFVVAGFEGEHILAGIYAILRQIELGEESLDNLYINAVKTEGNKKAQDVINKYFKEDIAMWRGLGKIPGSGLYLRESYSKYDAGSFGLDKDIELPPECKCAEVIIGKINPNECPMFDTHCNPLNPYGPCMVSVEGSCGIWHRNNIRR